MDNDEKDGYDRCNDEVMMIKTIFHIIFKINTMGTILRSICTIIRILIIIRSDISSWLVANYSMQLRANLNSQIKQVDPKYLMENIFWGFHLRRKVQLVKNVAARKLRRGHCYQREKAYLAHPIPSSCGALLLTFTFSEESHNPKK